MKFEQMLDRYTEVRLGAKDKALLERIAVALEKLAEQK